jgi:hypothetical protein
MNAIYNFMPATLTRDQMRLYQRARRARLKANSEPVVDAAIPRGALVRVPNDEWAAIRAKAAVIEPGAVITKSHGRLDVLSREAFEARHSSTGSGSPVRPPASQPARPPASQSVRLTAYTPPPRSLVAVGGQAPDHSGFGNNIASATAFFRANMTASLNTLAREAVETKRELAAQERRIAVIEAAANRRVDTANIMQAVLGLFNYATRR